MNSFARTRTLRKIAALFASCLVLAACGSGDGPESADDLEKVRFVLDFSVYGSHAPFWAGKEKGIYAKHGIDLETIDIGHGSSETARLVGEGKYDLGYADLPTTVIARSEGLPVKAVAAQQQSSPIGICTLEEKHNATSPDDLAGLRVGINYESSTYIFLQAFLEANDLTDKVDIKPVSEPRANYLLQGRVDAIACYSNAELPSTEETAEKQGKGAITFMPGARHGYDVLGSGVITTDAMIKERPEVVERFVAAYVESLQWVHDNVEDAAEIVADSRAETRTDAPLFVKQLTAEADYITSPATKEHGLGYMSAEQIENTVDVLQEQRVIETRPKAEDLYTNEYLPTAAKVED